MLPRHVVALDIGGTKLAAAVVDSDGRLTSAARVPTPHGDGRDGEALWEAVVGLIDRVSSGVTGDLVGVGVGCGGPMSWPDGHVSPLNIPAWRAFPLRDRLRDRFPEVPVRVHNDAVCVAVGEHSRGAGRGHANVLGMVVSTGVGGGLVLGNRLVDGSSGNAGHIGHVVVEPDGPACACGGRGCLEAIARGPAVAAWAKAHGWGRSSSTARDVAVDAANGDPVARKALARAGEALGVAIASAAHLLDVEVVAVGGGLSQAGPPLFDPLERALRRHARMDWAREVRVVPTELGQEAGLVGAAALVLLGDRYWNAD